MRNIKNVLLAVSITMLSFNTFAIDFNENIMSVNDPEFNKEGVAYISSQGEKNMLQSLEELNDEIFMGKEDQVYHVVAYRQKLIGGAGFGEKTTIMNNNVKTNGKDPIVVEMIKGFLLNSEKEYGGKNYQKTSVNIENIAGKHEISLSAIQYFPEGLYMSFEKKDVEVPMKRGDKTEVFVISELKSELNDLGSGKKYIDTFQITKLN